MSGTEMGMLLPGLGLCAVSVRPHPLICAAICSLRDQRRSTAAMVQPVRSSRSIAFDSAHSTAANRSRSPPHLRQESTKRSAFEALDSGCKIKYKQRQSPHTLYQQGGGFYLISPCSDSGRGFKDLVPLPFLLLSSLIQPESSRLTALKRVCMI